MLDAADSQFARKVGHTAALRRLSHPAAASIASVTAQAGLGPQYMCAGSMRLITLTAVALAHLHPTLEEAGPVRVS